MSLAIAALAGLAALLLMLRAGAQLAEAERVRRAGGGKRSIVGWMIGERGETVAVERGSEAAFLHRFTFPRIEGWKPATIEDALSIGNDMVITGHAFATEDGYRVDPLSVRVEEGSAYGGRVEAEGVYWLRWHRKGTPPASMIGILLDPATAALLAESISNSGGWLADLRKAIEARGAEYSWPEDFLGGAQYPASTPSERIHRILADAGFPAHESETGWKPLEVGERVAVYYSGPDRTTFEEKFIIRASGHGVHFEAVGP